MDWMGFDWDGDGYVDFGESMMTLAAFRMMQLQRENEYLQQQIGKLNDIDCSDYDLPYKRYTPTYYSKSSGFEFSIDDIIEPINKFLGRLFKPLYSLSVFTVRGWVIIYQIVQVNLTNLITRVGFTKPQLIILSILGVFTLIIFAAIGKLIAVSFLNIP